MRQRTCGGEAGADCATVFPGLLTPSLKTASGCSTLGYYIYTHIQGRARREGRRGGGGKGGREGGRER